MQREGSGTEVLEVEVEGSGYGGIKHRLMLLRYQGGGYGDLRCDLTKISTGGSEAENL